MYQLPKYFLDNENVLWRAKPRSSPITFGWWTYPKNLRRTLILVICYIGIMVFLFTPTVISVFGDSINRLIDLQIIISVGCITALGILIKPFLMWGVWYLISEHRVIWWSGETCHYMFFQNLERVTLRYDGNHDVLEWHGRVTAEHSDLYGTEVEKITFVGTKFIDLKDASSLIKLIEQKRGVIIPVEDRRYQAKSKKD
jgi:hypothetical protein